MLLGRILPFDNIKNLINANQKPPIRNRIPISLIIGIAFHLIVNNSNRVP